MMFILEITQFLGVYSIVLTIKNPISILYFYVLYSLSQVSAYFIIFLKMVLVHKISFISFSSKFPYPLNRKT